MTTNSVTRVLVLGASGMLGNTLFRFLASDTRYQVYGTVRDTRARDFLPQHLQTNLISGVDADRPNGMLQVFTETRPQIVINCIGVIKQHTSQQTPTGLLPINALFPHHLANVCALAGARLIHFSTDCVFSGSKGMYTESDTPDALDLYGQSKRMGEVTARHALTLRTSIIGHELTSKLGLVEWFLGQSNEVKGYTNAIFSGLPTVEVARVLVKHILPDPSLNGIYHLASEPTSKYELLSLIREIYNHDIDIRASSAPAINRSLDASKFNKATGYSALPWRQMVETMQEYR
jgi:dTDP-4-dehydrorhamnose reductase